MGYAVSKELQELISPEIYSRYLSTDKRVEFSSSEDGSEGEWVSGSLKIKLTSLLIRVVEQYSVKSIVFKSFADEPDKLVEVSGFETKAIGNAVISGNELQYGMAGYKY